MSNSKNHDDFFIKFDDINDSSDIFLDNSLFTNENKEIKDNSFKSTLTKESAISDDFIFSQSTKTKETKDDFIFLSDTKLNSNNDSIFIEDSKVKDCKIDNSFESNNMKTETNNVSSDYFIKIDDGDIVDQDKEKNELYIMNDNKDEEDALPHYNSPEYSEYMSKLNKDSLKEISMESVNNDSLTHKIKEEADEKYGKNKIQKFLFIAIAILFVASIATFGVILSGSNSSQSNLVGSNVSEKDLSDFDFLLKVTISSSNTSLQYYDELKEIAENKNTLNSNMYDTKLNEIKKSAEANLQEVNILNQYIDINNYNEIINLLKLRYENLIKVCNELSKTMVDNYKSIYNTYAKNEISVIESLNKEIVIKLDYFKIPYRIEGNAIVLDNN